jgi:signal transduction histidine kinase
LSNQSPISSILSRFKSSLKLTIFLRIFFALLAGMLISSLKLEYLESYTYDLRVIIKSKLTFQNLKSKNIKLILINSNSVEKLKSVPDFKTHSIFLEQLRKLDPRFVIYDFRSENGKLLDFEGSTADQKDFVKSSKLFSDFYIATNELEMRGTENSLKLLPPLDTLELRSCPRTSDISLFAKDGVSRRLMISYQGLAMLQPIISSYYNPSVADINNIKGVFDVLDSKQSYINYHPKGFFETFKFEDIIDGKVPANSFAEQIILVGIDTGKSSKDYAMTPYSREVTGMTSTELQANIFQTLIENNSPTKTPNSINIAITLLVSLLMVYIVLSLKPSRGLIIIAGMLALLATVAIFLLVVFDIWISLAHPLLTIFLCYYFFIPYRLIIENRRSWEYIQKNKLLQQVEELKTNFISMMSHDLKTPIARIQGMTEVILKDEVSLSNTQREAVDTIKGSSDDLLKFINSILQYGRIESQGVHLHKQSKDINQLLQDVIRKHEFLAKVKKIKISTKLEPMFPVQLDVDLMKQVLSNLVENAIKYSTEESTVTIKSSEEGNKVVVEVIDNGMGIPAEDLPNIFMKFYRSQNVKTSTIKGTGLGLYLAQYFAGLHGGEITVTSELGKGSTFKVTLPE